MTETKTRPPPPAKKHSAFAQVIYRKIGETGDLAGKALVGVGGFGALATVHKLADVQWSRLVAGLVTGGVAIGIGIYLQAKAEETINV